MSDILRFTDVFGHCRSKQITLYFCSMGFQRIAGLGFVEGSRDEGQTTLETMIPLEPQH
jgi:hypothetical protein